MNVELGLKQIITSARKDPLGNMMIDYMNGKTDAFVRVSSPHLDMWEMSGKVMFRPFSRMSLLERKALSLCAGSILDVGAGSGCHSLYLQQRHKRVDALDVSPGCIAVMKKRKIKHTVHNNLFCLEAEPYDTILMLMNGIGICGSVDGLNLFFQYIRGLLAPGGRILADSTDLADLYNPDQYALPEDRYYGETQFTMSYKAIDGDPFDWLYIDFHTLETCAAFHGFACEKIMADSSHRFLARLYSTQ